VWAVANSAALAIDYWPRSPMILGSGSEAAFTILKLVSLPSPLVGFILACLRATTERRTLQTWGTLALAAAVLISNSTNSSRLQCIDAQIVRTARDRMQHLSATSKPARPHTRAACYARATSTETRVTRAWITLRTRAGKVEEPG